MTAQEILDLIQISDAYSLELTEDLLDEEKNGCVSCSDANKIMQLIILKRQLIYKISIDDYGTETQKLYSCILSAIANYSGASISVDPNSSTPNTTIDVIIIGNESPYEITFSWSNFIDNGLAGRVRYENPAWAGWIPIISIDNMPFLVEGVDFQNLLSGGFILLSGGNVPAVYNGQVIRSLGYSPSSIPPIVLGVVLIQNNSVQSISYNDNFGGLTTLPAGQDYEKDPIIDNQQMYVAFPTGTTMTYTRYNSDGTVNFTVTYSNPSAVNYTESNMSITKRHEFIITTT